MLKIALCICVVFFGAVGLANPTCFADCCGSLIFSIKSEGEQEGKGVTQFSIFAQFPTLETARGHSWLCCYAVVFVISPAAHEKSARVSVISQVSV